MNKCLRNVMVFVFLVSFFSVASFAQGEIDLNYGLEIPFSLNPSYPGEVSIDGLYIKDIGNAYLISLKYSNGKLVTSKNGNFNTVKSSFFNPPNGDIFMISWINEFNRVSSTDHVVQYRVDKQKLKTVESITIFLYDVLYNNDDDNQSIYFDTNEINFESIPTIEALNLLNPNVTATNNFTFKKDFDLETVPSSWAVNSIMNLKESMLFSNSVFNVDYKSKITRAQFANLIAVTYETLIGEEIKTDQSISFNDTKDPAILKVATVGISSGKGNGNYDPNGLITREQMAAFIVNLMKNAGLNFDAPTHETLADNTQISDWAKESVYTVIANGTMNGTGDNKFSPKGNASIEMAMTIVNSILQKYK